MFWDLGDKQLRLDEATSWFIANLGWAGLWDAVSTSEANAGVYYAMLKLWLSLGESEATIRAFSVIFGIATIPVLYALALRLFGQIPALIASVLLAVNAFFVQNVQDARGYALATFLVSGASLLFVDVLWRPQWSRVAGYAVMAVLAVYVHFFSVLVLGAHLVSVLFTERRLVPVRQLVVAYASVALASIPLLGFTLVNNVGQIDWIPEPTWSALGKAIVQLSGEAGIWLAIVYGLALLLVVAAVTKRSVDREPFLRWRYAFVLLWGVGPIALAFLFSFLKPIFVSRYLLVSLPALALVAAAAFSILRGRMVVVAGLITATAVALSMIALNRWYETPGIRWTERLEQLADDDGADAGMVFYSPTMLRPYLYYAERTNVIDRLPELEYPSSYRWPGFSRTRYNPDYEAIAARAGEHERMWLIAGVTWDEPRQQEFRTLRETLREHCAEVLAEYRDPRVTLYGRCR